MGDIAIGTAASPGAADVGTARRATGAGAAEDSELDDGAKNARRAGTDVGQSTSWNG